MMDNMNRYLVIFVLVFIAVEAGYLLLSPDRTADTDGEQRDSVLSGERTPEQPHEPEQDASGDSKRVAAMRAAYAELEQARNTVRRQLGRLNARTWKLEVSPDEARAISEQMQQGHALLKNPPMLGAFADADDIRQELAKVTRVAGKLKDLETTVEENIAARETR